MTSAWSTRHNRSKSASDNNLEFTRHGTSYRLRKGDCTCQIPSKPNEIGSDNKYSSNIINEDSTNHRTSLGMMCQVEGRARTLKDHLYQCPCKLSEELVKCMVLIYCWMRHDTSVKSKEVRIPFCSRTSTKAVFAGMDGARDGQEPFCRSMVEISSISMDKHHLSGAAYAVSNYRLLVEQLKRVDVSALEWGAKLEFWINEYNVLVMHAHLAYGFYHGSLRRLALFHMVPYHVNTLIIDAKHHDPQ